MSELDDPIVNQAYCELVISCQYDGCNEDYRYSLEQTATDPVEEWAKSIADKARSDGWTSSKKRLVLCPYHSKLTKTT